MIHKYEVIALPQVVVTWTVKVSQLTPGYTKKFHSTMNFRRLFSFQHPKNISRRNFNNICEFIPFSHARVRKHTYIHTHILITSFMNILSFYETKKKER